MSDFVFDRLLICGIGLIGSSLARALRRAVPRTDVAGASAIIVGADRDAATLVRALELGVIDEAVLLESEEANDGGAHSVLAAISAISAANIAPTSFRTLADAVAGADVVVLAAPVAQTRLLLSAIAPYLRKDAVVSDVGSTKADVCEAAHAVLGAEAQRFVAAHPIAGAEASGVDAGCESLFDGRDVILCPVTDAVDATDIAADAVQRIASMWEAAGARPAFMTPAQHDRIFASVSHLPHLLAFGFIAHILQMEGSDERFAFAGSGFRDFSRIAASNPEMWRDICLANREALLEDLDHYIGTLNGLRAAIAAGDASTLDDVFSRSRRARADWRQGETLDARLARRDLPEAQAIPCAPDALCRADGVGIIKNK